MEYGDMIKQDQAVILPIPFSGGFTRDSTIASGTQVISGLGFKPSYCIFFVCLSSTQYMCNGVDDAVSARSIRKSGSTPSFNQDDGFSINIDTGPTGYSGQIQSMDTDGFTMDWTRIGAATGIIAVKYTAFK